MGYKYNAQETKVINSYIAGKNQSDAFRDGYKSAKNWSKKTVNEKASRFFAKDKVKARIEQLKNKSTSKAVLTRQECLEGLTKAFHMAMGVDEQMYEETVQYKDNGVIKEEWKKTTFKAQDLKNLKGIAETLAKLQGWEKQEDSKNTFAEMRSKYENL